MRGGSAVLFCFINLTQWWFQHARTVLRGNLLCWRTTSWLKHTANGFKVTDLILFYFINNRDGAWKVEMAIKNRDN